ncbi:unnamed protein product [Chrysoparadoxa australica]
MYSRLHLAGPEVVRTPDAPKCSTRQFVVSSSGDNPLSSREDISPTSPLSAAKKKTLPSPYPPSLLGDHHTLLNAIATPFPCPPTPSHSIRTPPIHNPVASDFPGSTPPF